MIAVLLAAAVAPLSGSFVCVHNACTGTLRVANTAPEIEGFVISAGRSAVTHLRVIGHPGTVVRTGPNASVAILFTPAGFVPPGSTVSFTFRASPPPVHVVVTPTRDRKTYLRPVTIGPSTASSGGSCPSTTSECPD